jgi:hypothetical protein
VPFTYDRPKVLRNKVVASFTRARNWMLLFLVPRDSFLNENFPHIFSVLTSPHELHESSRVARVLTSCTSPH